MSKSKRSKIAKIGDFIESQNRRNIGINDLPNEMLYYIFNILNCCAYKDMWKVFFVCRKWRFMWSSISVKYIDMAICPVRYYKILTELMCGVENVNWGVVQSDQTVKMQKDFFAKFRNLNGITTIYLNSEQFWKLIIGQENLKRLKLTYGKIIMPRPQDLLEGPFTDKISITFAEAKIHAWKTCKLTHLEFKNVSLPNDIFHLPITLTTIAFQNLSVRDQTLTTIASFCSELRNLSLDGLPYISNTGINEIAKRCVKLDYVKFINCCHIEYQNIIDFVKQTKITKLSVGYYNQQKILQTANSNDIERFKTITKTEN